MNFLKKWYIYQKERFPLVTYGLYCFCIVFGTFCFGNYLGIVEQNNLTEETGKYIIEYSLLIPMFIVGLLQFLMVRIVDEFKDYEEDCKYRPYRPVPRGVVTLKELKVLFILCVLLQIGITLWINPISCILLLVVWVFFGIMSKGFFIKKVLDKHILLEVLLDELLLPVTTLYLLSFIRPVELKETWKFLLMVYNISWIIEIARKIRCKEAEENGVKTYTAVFGIPKATVLLFFLETFLLIITSVLIGFKIYIYTIYGVLILINLFFIIQKNKLFSKCVEYLADLYVMICLVSLVVLIL